MKALQLNYINVLNISLMELSCKRLYLIYCLSLVLSPSYSSQHLSRDTGNSLVMPGASFTGYMSLSSSEYSEVFLRVFSSVIDHVLDFPPFSISFKGAPTNSAGCSQSCIENCTIGLAGQRRLNRAVYLTKEWI